MTYNEQRIEKLKLVRVMSWILAITTAAAWIFYDPLWMGFVVAIDVITFVLFARRVGDSIRNLRRIDELRISTTPRPSLRVIRSRAMVESCAPDNPRAN